MPKTGTEIYFYSKIFREITMANPEQLTDEFFKKKMPNSLSLFFYRQNAMFVLISPNDRLTFTRKLSNSLRFNFSLKLQCLF